MNASDETEPAPEGGALPDETYSLLESVVLWVHCSSLA